MPNLKHINSALPGQMAARIPAACHLSGLSRSALYREAAKGNIRLLKLGRATLVDLGSLRAFLASLPAAPVRAPRASKAD